MFKLFRCTLKGKEFKKNDQGYFGYKVIQLFLAAKFSNFFNVLLFNIGPIEWTVFFFINREI